MRGYPLLRFRVEVIWKLLQLKQIRELNGFDLSEGLWETIGKVQMHVRSAQA
jgi:hypothetical protein